MREKGFTLIELLAVIVVLAVISLIAMPMIMSVITASRENAVKIRAQNYAYAVEAAALNLQAEGLDFSEGTFNTSLLDNYIKYDGPKVSGIVTLKNGAVIGYDLYIDGYRVKKEGDIIITELSDKKPGDGINDIYVKRDGSDVHITDSSELQDGDVFVNGQYEYHYNEVHYINDSSVWSIDTTLNGWSMVLTSDALDDEEINTPMVTKIFGKNIVSMRFLFFSSKAKKINVSSFDTSNVVDMHCMFANCKSIGNLDLSTFDTSNVVDMNGMFYECTKLNYLNISGFNTSKVTDMGMMLAHCWFLKKLDVGSLFVIGKDTNYDSMFSGCCLLSNINSNSVLYDAYMKTTGECVM